MKKRSLLILYWLLLFLLLIYPHILDNHMFFMRNTPLADTIINFILIAIGVSIYIFNQRQIDFITQQKKDIEWNLEKSYQHIGIANCSIEYLKDTIKWISEKQHSQKEIIHKLLFIIKQSEKWQIQTYLPTNQLPQWNTT